MSHGRLMMHAAAGLVLVAMLTLYPASVFAADPPATTPNAVEAPATPVQPAAKEKPAKSSGFSWPSSLMPSLPSIPGLGGGSTPAKPPADAAANHPDAMPKKDDGKPAGKPKDPAQAAREQEAADKAMQESTAKVVQMMFSKVDGQVKVGSAVLNWSDPIVVKSLEISDPDGSRVMAVEEVQLSKTLSQMMLNPLAPAGTKLIRPQFFVSIGKESTNFQRVLGAWFLAEIAGKDPRDMNLEVVDGQVHIVHEATGKQVVLSSLNFAIVPDEKAPADRRFALSFDAPLQGGKLNVAGRYDRKADRVEFTTIAGDYQPYALGASLAGVITEMRGKQQLELNGSWSYDLQVFAAMAQAQGKNVDIAGKRTQPLRVAVDIHDLASSLLAQAIKKSPAGGTIPTDAGAPENANGPANANAPNDPNSGAPADGPQPRFPPPAPGINLPPQPAQPSRPNSAPPPNQPPPLNQPPLNQPPRQVIPDDVPVMPTSLRKAAVADETVEPAPLPGATAGQDYENPAKVEPAKTTSTASSRHWSKAITIETKFGWDAARWAELYVGEAEVDVRVRDGWALVLPTRVPFSDGVLNLAGGVYFGGSRLELAVPAGPLLENVRLTPELCDYVLTWVAPFVAQATNIEGFFSVDLDRCLVLLSDLPNSDVRGRLLVDGVRMDVSALIRETAFKLLGGDLPLGPIQMQLLNASQTEFHFTEGRMFHEGMGLVMGDKTLYTNGSIGLDHTLDLLIDLTLPFNWLPNGPLGRRLKGTRVQVPVVGTVEKPQIGKIKLPNGLGDGLNDGPLSRLLRGNPGELPPGQPPFANPADGRTLPPGAAAPPAMPPRPIGRGGVFDRLRNSGILPPR